ncbi:MULTISPECIES: hypothetical protein [unclassified Sphingomonas]|uniref:hypothetical protein n=1 Tax=unclassified Sphingomonas TaxID=196159 RepID=UPI001AC17552|nr:MULTISPECIES: hypothetical protein [unclassified Sphingomonas]MBN8848189.1 hypothetical protein [Sphingomonas sp.]
MGLNVIVTTLDGRQHPDWDDGRYSGDRALFGIANAVPRIDHIADPGFGGANDWYWRPADFDAFRAAEWPAENRARWAKLADILEKAPEFWIFMSI